MHYPLSRDEHAAMVRYLADIRKQLECVSKQLEDVSNLFSTRYGNTSRIADLAGKTLLSSTLLQQEIMMIELNGDGADAQIKHAAGTV